jgi:hypothetical protein
MKVLKPGRNQKGWSKKKTCTGKGNGGGGCGAVLLVEQGDIFLTHNYVRDEHDIFHTFKCVACGVLTDFEEGEVPGGLGIPDQKDWKAPAPHHEGCNCLDCRTARGGEPI